jgi:uncharacterized protein (TIGR02145 family)
MTAHYITKNILVYILLIALTTSCANNEVKDVDGNIYPTTKIGEQVWMTKNLDVTRFNDGTPIPQAKTDDEWEAAAIFKQPAWCYYENDVTYGTVYGKLYNWYAVNDPRGLAPENYHIPTENDWDKLIFYLDDKCKFNYEGRQSENAGGHMKSIEKYWQYPNTNADNSSGYNALPSGNRGSMGMFFGLGFDADYWSATEYDNKESWIRGLWNEGSGVGRTQVDKGKGLAVRCVKN